jgi:hypothetical protein
MFWWGVLRGSEWVEGMIRVTVILDGNFLEEYVLPDGPTALGHPTN